MHITGTTALTPVMSASKVSGLGIMLASHSLAPMETANVLLYIVTERIKYDTAVKSGSIPTYASLFQ